MEGVEGVGMVGMVEGVMSVLFGGPFFFGLLL